PHATPTPEPSTLSLHDALPICRRLAVELVDDDRVAARLHRRLEGFGRTRRGARRDDLYSRSEDTDRVAAYQPQVRVGALPDQGGRDRRRLGDSGDVVVQRIRILDGEVL